MKYYMDAAEFLRTAFRDYKVGALTPSSKYAVRKVVQAVKPEYAHIVEYGAGDGVITRGVLARMPAEGRLAAIELNNQFLPELSAIHDPRLEVVHADVLSCSQNLRGLGLPKIDAVISGVPFSFFTTEIREELVRNTARAIEHGGAFIVYQYSPLIIGLLKKYFLRVHVSYEPRNFPPYFVMVAEK
jgi:phospholipid N-methyltransferase